MIKKHGNDHFWSFIEENWDRTKPIEIWQSLGNGDEEVMGYAMDRFNAEQIVDALITADKVNDDPDNKLTKREMLFLDFVASNCPEPYATEASNGILWNDRETYKRLKSMFNEIY